MRLSGNTILITGGGSGIGRALAEEFHARGNQVIIAGRREALLAEVAAAHPGMAWIGLDIADPASITSMTQALLAGFPKFDTLVNCAGIQTRDDASGPIDDEELLAAISTNLLGPIRLSSALIDHLKHQDNASIVTVSSMLGYLLPLAKAAIYSATKAALHSFTQSQRYMLRGSCVAVIEIVPPYVQTDLMGGAIDPRAMPLADFMREAMALLDTDAAEILVAPAKGRRDALRGDELAAVSAFNDMFG